MTQRAGLLVGILSLMFAGCASHRESLQLDTARVPAVRLIAAVRTQETAVLSFTGRGSVSFESPEASGSVFFSVALQKPDSLLVRFEGPFGINVGFLFADRQSFVLYNAMENWYAAGPAGAAGIRSVLPVDLTFDQLIDAFTGTFRLPENRLPASYSIDDGQYLLVFPQGAGMASYWIDSELHAVTHYRLAEGDSALVEAATDDWTEEDGRHVPRRITLTFPASSRQVSVYYSSVDVTPDALPFSYEVPAKARHRVFR
jgi:hypothetical protein